MKTKFDTVYSSEIVLFRCKISFFTALATILLFILQIIYKTCNRWICLTIVCSNVSHYSFFCLFSYELFQHCISFQRSFSFLKLKFLLHDYDTMLYASFIVYDLYDISRNLIQTSGGIINLAVKFPQNILQPFLALQFSLRYDG